MTLGEKIKSARKRLNITQSELCTNVITRNMLSSIERGKASPSLSTLNYISSVLKLPISYLISDEDDLFFYEKKDSIDKIKSAFAESKYQMKYF